jgi:hypothetical protein
MPTFLIMQMLDECFGVNWLVEGSMGVGFASRQYFAESSHLNLPPTYPVTAPSLPDGMNTTTEI